MSVTITIRTLDESQSKKQRTIYDKVVKFFKFPDLKLLVILDDAVCEEFRNEVGAENRGFFIPTNAQTYDNFSWPSYIAEKIRKKLGSYTFEYPFEGMVYVHGDVCRDEFALPMTLAHELQHFVQYGNNQKNWAWNSVLMNCGNLIKQEGLSWINFPTEFEARLVAKRIHQNIFGSQDTEQYIVRRQKDAIEQRDAEDWKFIQKIDITMSYDCILETRSMLRRLCKTETYRIEIENALNRAIGNPAFNSLSLYEIIQTDNCDF